MATSDLATSYPGSCRRGVPNGRQSRDLPQEECRLHIRQCGARSRSAASQRAATVDAVDFLSGNCCEQIKQSEGMLK